MYICECGKEFDNPQKFNGHKQGCKVHLELKYGSIDAYYAIKNRGHAAGVETKKKQTVDRKAQCEIDWISERHICEKCGKVMTEKFGSGRFCSRACANSHVQTTEQNLARKNKLSKTTQTLFCKNCGIKISARSKSGYCKSCFHVCVPYSEATKQKQHTAMVGCSRWNIHRNQISYAEKFFMDVLANNNLDFEHEFQVKTADNVHCYYLDFLLPNNVDLEIDGAQHKYRKDEDNNRDEYLQSIGYVVYRIEWNEIKTEKGKNSMKEKIDNFLSFYNSLLENNN